MGLFVTPAAHPVQAQEILSTPTRPQRPRTATPTIAPWQAGWTAPDLIFTSRGALHTPFMVADDSGRIHLFWKIIEGATVDGDPSANILYYSQRTRNGWTRPVDIQVSSAIFNPVAVADHYGMLHLFWSGVNSQLFYARAPVDGAWDARTWTQPQAFDQMNFSPHVAVDQDNVLHVVYPGNQARGVYYMRSTDGGKHWSSSINISPTAQLNTSAEYARIAVSPSGVLHVVWTEFQLPTGWPPTGLFYIRSDDDGRTWTSKAQITAMNYDQANVIAASDTEIHIIYNAIVSIQGRYHRVSQDGGETWSTTNVITDLGGTEGIPQGEVDSVGRLHVISTYDECNNYHFFANGVWSERFCLVDVPPAVSNLDYSDYIEEPAMTITRGNHLYTAFWDDRKRLWFSEYELADAFTLPRRDFAPTPEDTVVPTLTQPVQTPTQTLTPLPNSILEGEIEKPRPLDSLALDLLPSVLVLCVGIGAVVFFRSQHRRS